MSYNKPIFIVDKFYRVKQTFKSGSSNFQLDEVLVFVKDYYSIYDSSFVYEFRDTTAGETKYWWLRHDDSSSRWEDFFEML
jgi:hypothetical protein